ncbi:hypothetical protein P5673_005386 [Acropora cervicornis]|nr:hypothetical protein P5673_005386 [Acropora cervicornis]
MVETLD